MAAQTHRLLIVDDSMIVRDRIHRLCATAGFPEIAIVGLAANGEEAIALAQRKQPTLVTMDLTMPGIDGETCIAHLAELVPDARILVVSALADKATALRAIRRGAHGFIHKPFRDYELAHALTELMEYA